MWVGGDDSVVGSHHLQAVCSEMHATWAGA